MEAAPGEDKVLGVGGYEKFGFELDLAGLCSSGREDEAEALDAWLPSSTRARLAPREDDPNDELEKVILALSVEASGEEFSNIGRVSHGSEDVSGGVGIEDT